MAKMRKYYFCMSPELHTALKDYAPKVDMRASQVMRHAIVEYWQNRGGEHEIAALRHHGAGRRQHGYGVR